MHRAESITPTSEPRTPLARVLILTLLFYMQLLVGGALISISLFARDWFYLRTNPISLELLLVAVPLLSGLFLLAYSDNKNWGADGFARDRLAETTLFLTLLLIVTAGATQILTKASDCDSAILAHTYNQSRSIPNGCKSLIPSGWVDVVTLGGSLNFLAALWIVPLQVLVNVFDFETILYFSVIIAMALILLETHHILVTSKTGIKEEGSKNSRQVSRMQRAIADRLVLRRFRVLLSLYIAEAPDIASRGLERDRPLYGKELRLRLLRLLSISCFTVVFYLLSWKVLGQQNSFLLSYAWLYLLATAFAEVTWLRRDARPITAIASVGMSAVLVLYLTVIEAGHSMGQTVVAVVWLLLLLSLRLLRTFVTSRSAPSTDDLRWCVGMSMSGPAGGKRFLSCCFFNLANHRFNVPKKWMHNQIAGLLYRRQMNEDIRGFNDLLGSLDGLSGTQLEETRSNCFKGRIRSTRLNLNRSSSK